MTSNQEKFEYESHLEAIGRRKQLLQRAKDKTYYSSTDEGQHIFRGLFLPYARAVIESIDAVNAGRASAWASYASFTKQQLDALGAEYVAFIALKKIIDCIDTGNNKLTDVATIIGRSIENESRINFYLENAGKETESLIKSRLNKKNSTPRYKSYGVKKSVENQLLEKGWSKEELFNEWAGIERTGVGLFLIEAAVRQGWFARTAKRVSGTKSPNFLYPSQDLAQYQQKLRQKMDDIADMGWPLIEPPLDWKFQEAESRFNTTGGYHSQWLRQTNPLCRGRHYQSVFGEEAIRLLNVLQRTGWSIDQEVLKVVELCWEKKISIGSFNTPFDDPRLSEGMPNHLQGLDESDPERKAWRKHQHSLHEAHEKQKLRGRSAGIAFSLAKRFVSQSPFFLSWSCDFRGRMYDQQTWLGRQKSDFEKALLRFAEGCKLDTRAEEWAARAVGAAYLGSRGSSSERSNWAYEHRELLEAITDDPIGTASQWEGADEPWQFLQLAIEWTSVVLRKTKPLWQVPVTADSTASGLQLLSAMRRDPKGMEFSNLTPKADPDAPPKDAYLEVLRVAREIAEASQETAWLAKHLIHRSLGKPVLMIAIYGGSYRTNRDDVVEALRKEGLYPDPISWEDTKTITDLLTKASKQVFPAAFETLEWLRQLASAAIKADATGFSWRTPTGDLIHHAEYEYAEPIRIQTHLLGKVSIGLGSVNVPDTKRLKSGFSPNFVHSYDAALLKAAFHGWDSPIVTIHDCIGVLPTDMDKALESVRRAFVRVCDGDPLEDLAEALTVNPESLKRLPQGDGQLHQVLNADYMFN